MSQLNCLMQRNPGAGFENQHRSSCHWCKEDAVVHYNISCACGNACAKCARRFRREQVEEGIYVVTYSG